MWKLFFLVFACLVSEFCASQDSLLLTHIIYRHGNRTPNFSHLPIVNNPYANETFFPFGIGHLTLDGRRRAYNLGIKLRKRYSEFLGDLYYTDLIEARSSNSPRCVMSMQSVLASLFPPTSEWELKSGLEWQPAYFFAPSIKDDKLIYPSCDKITKLHGVMDEEFYNYVEQNTGINITSSFEMMRIWNIYHNLEELGFELPEWVLAQWPQPFAKFGLQYWKRVADQSAHYVIGPLLKKMNIDTMRKINNTLIPKDRKMFMYSGHDINVVGYLGAIGVFKENMYINYSASILIEVHQVNDDYFVKVLFDNYDGKEHQVIKIPACGGVELCPLNTYISITEEKYGPEEWCT
ncbi:PREDICTED: venom acid phosphatase Acph-1-like [Nicrophorus vespilloides]|uniref:Venom acid phosphatase Acph-1-like n=1 Tax=Nicrophorus vespilloides TaxID=110193 RepID=A0ABM1N1K8_NICVS|nr:PREDICTED: venom acid phosphatase Acph-1-like [Nicrophorus vespilloides]